MHNPYTLIKKISHLHSDIECFINQRLENSGATGLVVSHGNILVRLYQEDKQAMNKIAGNISRCKSTLTVLVDKLEKAGYITRSTNEQDTRIKNLCLTDKGRDFKKTFFDISEELNTKIWKGFTPEEQQTLLSLLERVEKNIEIT